MGNSIAGALTNSVTTVTTTATAIPSSAKTGRRTILVYNNGSNTVYLGGSAVTTASGYPLNAGEEKAFDLSGVLNLYGITDTDTSEIRTLEGD
jgi:hypothetical protein